LKTSYLRAPFISSTKHPVLINDVLRGGADKSLVRPTSRCRRTESIVSLERGVYPCAEWQVFSRYRGWKEACQALRAISTTWRRELSSTPPPLQGKAPNKIHTILTETLGEHAPSYTTVKNWVGQFKRDDFSTCDAPQPGLPKTVSTPEIIDRIYGLILEDRRISAKLIAEQLGISRGRVGSPWSGSRNAWKRIKNVNGANSLSKFWIFFGAIQMISCCDWWSWKIPGYITMTRRQSNSQWSDGIAAHPAPKYSDCKNSLEKFSPREGHHGVLFLHDNVPGSPDNCNPEETGLPVLPMSWSLTLFSGSSPGGLLPATWTEKKIESSPFFVGRGGHCCRRDLVGGTVPFLMFFWAACKSYSNGLRSVRGEYVE